jgi:hypothetical protein
MSIAKFFFIKLYYESPLIGSLVIGDKLSIEDHGSMSPTVIGSELEPHDSITDPQIRLNWW